MNARKLVTSLKQRQRFFPLQKHLIRISILISRGSQSYSFPYGGDALIITFQQFASAGFSVIPSDATPYFTRVWPEENEMPLIVIGILIVGAIFILAGMYNSLVQLRVRADSAWSDIDVQLKRRHDLIPNLVETVKGYAAHEKGTFENIAKFRSQAMQATTPADKAQAEGQLSGALKSLFAVAENYPELKASEQFTGLQSSLNSIEDNIQNARRYYNAVVRDFNTRVQSFPTNILAGMFGFHAHQFFEMDTPADRENVAVKF